MRIVSVGGGPAGLYSALLVKKANAGHEVTVIDRNPPDATYGWGVVFSDETLGFLEEADAETYQEIVESLVQWGTIETRYRGRVIRSGGHAFSGVSRRKLLNILQQRCAQLGVELCFETEVADPHNLMNYDLILAADGLNSLLRTSHAEVFKPSFDTHGTKYIWLGAELPLGAFTFDFRETEWGMFQVHSYPFAENMATVIVECTEATWVAAGLDTTDEADSLAFCEALFSEFLQGRPLLSNRSTWINFVTLRNETWHCGNIALVGDAAHTAHFSVGSGTKLAMEDAIALSQMLEQHPSNLNRALVEYEQLREPLVERTQLAARESSRWFENVARYARFDPPQFAFSLLTRSKRITYENLKLRDPDFSDEVDLWFARHAEQGPSAPVTTYPPPEPLFVPYRLRDVTLANRLVGAAPAAVAMDGAPGDRHLVEMASLARFGIGLLRTELTAVSTTGRVTPEGAGLWNESQARSWTRITEYLHTNSQSRVALLLGHAGRRGSTRRHNEGADVPLPNTGWPLLAASALPYAERSPMPKEMNITDLRAVCEEFVRSALLADDCGFDALELHCGHGYLLAGFISPLTNRRQDAYGGSLENRLRYPLEVFDAVRGVWPQRKPLIVCISVTDWARGGTTPGDAVRIAAAFKDHGCDMIDVVSGQTTWDANPEYGRSWETPLSDLIRNEARVQTLVSGNLNSSDEVNTILAAGRADLCVLAPRPANDPRWLFRIPVPQTAITRPEPVRPQGR